MAFLAILATFFMKTAMSKTETEVDSKIIIDEQVRKAGCDRANKGQVWPAVADRLGRDSAAVNEAVCPAPWPIELPQRRWSGHHVDRRRRQWRQHTPAALAPRVDRTRPERRCGRNEPDHFHNRRIGPQ
jgi:hypothetical protein